MSAIEKAIATYERLEKILEATCKVIEQFNASTEQSTVTIYKEELDKSWQEYYDGYVKIESVLTGKKDDELKKYLVNFGIWHEIFINSRIKIMQSSAASSSQSDVANSSAFNLNQSLSGNSARPNFNLPAITIRTFTGHLEDWPEFRATCATVLLDSIPEIQRLQILKNSLADEPLELIKHITPVDGAFNSAWMILKNRYDNTRAIVFACLARFLDLPAMKNESIEGLKGMLNVTNHTLATLKCYQVAVSTWDPILVYILARKLDSYSLKHWEESLKGSKALPSLISFFEFIDVRINILTNTAIFSHMDTQSASHHYSINRPTKPAAPRSQPVMLTLKSSFKCFLCSDNHIVARCPVLSKATDRVKLVDEKSLCRNCLNRHCTEDCPYTPNCRYCDEAHHSLLHGKPAVNINIVNDTQTESYSTTEEINDEADEIMHTEQIFHTSEGQNAILATAIFPITHDGKIVTVRALVDQGATANLITKRMCQILKLKMTPTYVPLTGPCDVKVGCIKEKTIVTMKSNFDAQFSLTCGAYVVKTVTGLKPVETTKLKDWPHIKGLPLADPKFLEFSHIDMLIGSVVYAEIIQNGLVKGRSCEPIAQLTSLGWIISGAADKVKEKEIHCNTLYEEEALNQQLATFWQLDEVESKRHFTTEEQQAEDVFQNSVKRCVDGHFMVDLPFKSDPEHCFGESYNIAKRRYHALQCKLSKDPNLEAKYNDVIGEYLTLGHMELAKPHDKPFVCLPHHCVIKDSSSTTKVRGVFDASAKTSNGVSLNSQLCVGPTIQPDLFDLLMRWRRFKYAFSGDIEKMYRQVRVNPKHANYQCILWQPPEEKDIQRYKLLTVTFGTASAAFQAIRALHEVANEVKNMHPVLAANILLKFYVDDYLGCEKSIDEACKVREELSSILAEYGFKLRKWKASHDEILVGVADDDREKILDFDSTIKTLGISWNHTNDEFVFKACSRGKPDVWTKRNVLAEIARLFDPLGWMAPCVIKAKILMQNLWRASIEWDESLSEDLLAQWLIIYEQLSLPIPIKIKRWIGLADEVIKIELHGFSDASTAAYGAAIYLRLFHLDGRIVCNLIAAKTKVSPINPIVTIPRLELCGALLLSRLYGRVQSALELGNVPIYAWTDSMITLSWLAAHPSKWSIFVANRTSEILKTLPFEHWHHISTKENPADLASRGVLINELDQSQLWWHGPTFLSQSSVNCNKSFEPLNADELPEQRKTIHMIQISENDILNQFSDLNALLRFTSYVIRWYNKTKNKKIPIDAPLSADELNEAEQKWIRIIQRDHYKNEINTLYSKKEVPQKSSLAQLSPFIDVNGILRMNGRVNNKDFEEQKVAVILPANSKFTELLIRSTHIFDTMHGGVQMTLAALRTRFWIVSVRNTAKRIIRKCVVCFRFNKTLMKQRMADLPAFRTQRARPFAYVGCDYAGYFEVKTSERRNASYAKGYVALFVCLATKAIHLELVNSLLTADFLLAFQNFIARRGIPLEFHSDNGTNFIGAAREIHQMHEQMYAQNNELTKFFATKRICFKNIPARASHMGGIWERSVGLMKSHLYRVLKGVKLTARHFDHVLKQIEACLNSRPLWTVHAETEEGEVLTPSHFFNFQAINTLPQPDVSHLPLNRLDQYQYLYRLYCDFWKSWSKDYLSQLQPRSKWQRSHENVKVGQIVIVSDDNAPPSHWKLGRIVETFPGGDQLVRVVDVLCNGTILKRPIHRLGMLPILDNEVDPDHPFNAGEDVGDE